MDKEWDDGYAVGFDAAWYGGADKHTRAVIEAAIEMAKCSPGHPDHYDVWETLARRVRERAANEVE
jgi:hypothetical protein